MYRSISFSSFGAKSENKIVDTENWRKKIDISVFPQVARRKVTLKYRPIILTVVILLALLTLTFFTRRENHDFQSYSISGKFQAVFPLDSSRKASSYNKTYPLTKPITTLAGTSFFIGVITDMDTNSKDPNKESVWNSVLRFGNLSFNNQTRSVSIKWHSGDESGIRITGSYAYKGRGMELSELVVFDGGIFSIDDRTGIVYRISDGKASPWAILSDGNGKDPKGFKGEWMAVKGEQLYIGGLGKEWTTGEGVVLHSNPQWIKIIDKHRSVSDVNWIAHYKAMQKASGYESPGYIIHESAAWSDVHRSWFFLPRRASHEKYNEVLDELRATNLLFQCSEDFSNIKVKRIGEVSHVARGFSSFKFIPGSDDQVIVALKTEEVKGETRSYITAFTLDGVILLPDTVVSEQYKYEGFEFL